MFINIVILYWDIFTNIYFNVIYNIIVLYAQFMTPLNFKKLTKSVNIYGSIGHSLKSVYYKSKNKTMKSSVIINN